MQQNFPLMIIFLLASSLLLLFFINKKQRKTMVHLKQNLSQQINTNEHLNRITTELRRSTKILSIIANTEGYEDSIEENVDQIAKLYIGNIDYSVKEEELENIFAEYGEISCVNIPIDRYSGKARGFGFITFENISDAIKAIDLNGYEIKGRAIQVNFAKERENQKNKAY